MNNTISLAYLPKMYSYNLEGQRVTVTLINNPFDFSPRTLYSLAARKNKKRGFLFVSSVLGKHVPVDPFVSLLAGAALAIQLMSGIYDVDHVDSQDIIQALKSNEDTEQVYKTVLRRPLFALPEETLFIGFAETATGLGHAVFSLFDNAHYLHTTREQIPLLASKLNFSEDHSHAVNHRCYPLDPELLRIPKTIILVDDEITTGNTALNIIQAIHCEFPKTNYVVLSLLDWRTSEDHANFTKLEQQLDIKIHTISLLTGEIAVSSDPINERIDNVNRPLELNAISGSEVFPELKFLHLRDMVPVFSEDSAGYKNVTPYLKLTGRFGVSSSENLETMLLAREIGEELINDRIGEKTLCLGTGEFMYFPMLVSAYMGKGVSYHSTTRSPIFPFAQRHYAIQNGWAYPCPDDGSIMNYVYNVPLKYYDEVYLFLEREVSHERMTPMLIAFKKLGIPRLVLVIGVASSRNQKSEVVSRNLDVDQQGHEVIV
ncbi:MAG: phosphoribosyltransferase family protein [Desulfosporosinus sp.]|nr:phosphoribosyltransferase family protein [Desulfosporosinus sp.]